MYVCEMYIVISLPLWARINHSNNNDMKVFELTSVAESGGEVRQAPEGLRWPEAIGLWDSRSGADRDNTLASLSEAGLEHSGFLILHHQFGIAARQARLQLHFLASWGTKSPPSGLMEVGRKARSKWICWAGCALPAHEQLGLSYPCVPDPSLDKSGRVSPGNGQPRKRPVAPG